MEDSRGDYSLFENEPGDNQEGIPTQEVYQHPQGGNQEDAAHWTDEEVSGQSAAVGGGQFQAPVGGMMAVGSVPLGAHTADAVNHLEASTRQASQGADERDAEEEQEDHETQHLSKEERRRLKKEKKKKDKEKKKKKKKRKKSHHDDDGRGGEHDPEKPETSEQAGPERDDLEDDTLGGFIERDPEAAIHEAEDEKIPVEGGINSDVSQRPCKLCL